MAEKKPAIGFMQLQLIINIPEITGYLLGVNPFDQPGVEAYKRNMFKLLGKSE